MPKVRRSLVAVLAGWAAAMAATLPMEFEKIYTNATGGLSPLVWSLGAGTFIWCAWSLSIASVAWLCGGLPLIAFVPETWLLRHPRRSIVISALLGWSVVLIQFKTWQLLRPYERLAVRSFSLYSLLMLVFTGAAAAVYLHLLARDRRGSR